MKNNGSSSAMMGRISIARHGGASASSAPRTVNIRQPLPGKIIMSFVDGHVESVKLDRFGISTGTKAMCREPSGRDWCKCPPHLNFRKARKTPNRTVQINIVKKTSSFQLIRLAPAALLLAAIVH